MLTAGVITRPGPVNYTQGPRKKIRENFSLKNSHSAENEPTPYLYTLRGAVPCLNALMRRTSLIH